MITDNSNAAILCMKCRAVDHQLGSELGGPYACEMKEKYNMWHLIVVSFTMASPYIGKSTVM